MTEAEIQQACDTQAATIAAELKTAGAEIAADREIVALIAYLQKLGKAEKVTPQGGKRRPRTAAYPQSASVKFNDSRITLGCACKSLRCLAM